LRKYLEVKWIAANNKIAI